MDTRSNPSPQNQKLLNAALDSGYLDEVHDLPKIDFIQAPTPLHRLNRASEDLGVDLWIKRDDLTGFAMGGNKGRKLEYTMAAVAKSGADVVVTCGSLQSNFIRQLGAACSVMGVRCVAAVMDKPYEFELPSQPGLLPDNGNVLLDSILGVDFHVLENGTWETLFDHAETVAKSLEESGNRVYRIPIGGSSPEGACGFYRAGLELQSQADSFDSIVFASSSGSTQVGLSHAYRKSPTKVIGIACDPEPEIANDFAVLSEGLGQLIGESGLEPAEFIIDFNFVGPGYGIPSESGQRAIEYLAGREGIFLDPIYSAKAFAGLMELAGTGILGSKICFWHTGGLPSLFSLRPEHL